MSPGDKFCQLHTRDLDIVSIQDLIYLTSGLADALEVREDELFVVNNMGKALSLTLNRNANGEKVSLQRFAMAPERQAIADMIKGGHRGQQAQLGNVLAARHSSDEGQKAEHFKTTPFFPHMLRVAGITPDKLVAGQKGHLGAFRTHAKEMSTGRRNFQKTPWPIEYTNEGRVLMFKEAELGPGIKLFSIESSGVDKIALGLPMIFPHTTLQARIGLPLGAVFDDEKVNDLLQEQIIESVVVTNNHTTVTFVGEPLEEFVSGGTLDEDEKRIHRKLDAWAKKKPRKC